MHEIADHYDLDEKEAKVIALNPVLLNAFKVDVKPEGVFNWELGKKLNAQCRGFSCERLANEACDEYGGYVANYNGTWYNVWPASESKARYWESFENVKTVIGQG